MDNIQLGKLMEGSLREVIGNELMLNSPPPIPELRYFLMKPTVC